VEVEPRLRQLIQFLTGEISQRQKKANSDK